MTAFIAPVTQPGQIKLRIPLCRNDGQPDNTHLYACRQVRLAGLHVVNAWAAQNVRRYVVVVVDAVSDLAAKCQQIEGVLAVSNIQDLTTL